VLIPRPPAVGDADVVAELRSVLFSEPILGAARVRPKGYGMVLLSHLFGAAGALMAKRATEPLPPTVLYLAVTPVDIRLFSKPMWSDAYEIGRWTKSSYSASLEGTRLLLELERLGRVTLRGGQAARAVLEVVVEGAAGPAAPSAIR